MPRHTRSIALSAFLLLCSAVASAQQGNPGDPGGLDPGGDPTEPGDPGGGSSAYALGIDPFDIIDAMLSPLLPFLGAAIGIFLALLPFGLAFRSVILRWYYRLDDHKQQALGRRYAREQARADRRRGNFNYAFASAGGRGYIDRNPYPRRHSPSSSERQFSRGGPRRNYRSRPRY